MWAVPFPVSIGMWLVVIGWLVAMWAMFGQLGRENFDASNETSLAKHSASQGKGLGA
ncbi:MAG: hypothetical protein M0031_09150 [Thermaerobacter sp.]|jgi:hypothetical protein|nr:hypothetical protein [Thermaerobacter sp.]